MTDQDQAAQFAAFQAWQASQASQAAAAVPANEVVPVDFADVIRYVVRSTAYPNQSVQDAHLAAVDAHFAPAETPAVEATNVVTEPSVETGAPAA